MTDYERSDDDGDGGKGYVHDTQFQFPWYIAAYQDDRISYHQKLDKSTVANTFHCKTLTAMSFEWTHSI